MPYKDKKQMYRNQIKRWINRKIKAIEYKGGCCNRCGYNKHYAAMHFHHTNPEDKKANWTKIRLWSWHKVLDELDKCELLCANCHAIEHAGIGTRPDISKRLTKS